MSKLDWFNNVENRPHPWEGMGLTWLTTALNVPDVKAAINFYTEVMKMVVISELEGDGGDVLFARIRYRDGRAGSDDPLRAVIRTGAGAEVHVFGCFCGNFFRMGRKRQRRSQ